MKPGRFSALMIILTIMLVSPIAFQASAEGGESSIDHPFQGTFKNPLNWSDDFSWRDGAQFLGGKGDWSEASRMVDEMIGLGKEKGLLGSFTYDQGAVEGNFLSFEVDEVSGITTDLSLVGEEGRTIFEIVEIEDLSLESIETQGSIILIEGEEAQMIVHDNPMALVHIVTQTEMMMSFMTSGKVSQTAPSPMGQGGMEAVLIDLGNVSGTLATSGGTIELESSRSATYINVTLDGSLFFRLSPDTRGKATEGLITQAIWEERIGGEMLLLASGDGAIADIIEYQDQFRMRVLSAHRNSVQLQVSSENHEGRVIMISMDKETMSQDNRQLKLSLNGVEIDIEENLVEVLYAEEESTKPLYSVVDNGDIITLAIYIPSFSEQSITIESIAPYDALFSPMGVAAAVAAIVIAVVALAVILKR